MSDLLLSPVSQMAFSGPNIDDTLWHFSNICQLSVFTGACAEIGFVNAAFVPNESLQRGSRNFDKFSTKLGEFRNDGPPVTLGLVFHGTPEVNIRSILFHGLDANRRSGQALGPGEYFATDPRISHPYCQGGSKIVVFVVVMPATEPRQEGVVVAENNHDQLAIGTLQFDSFDQFKMIDLEALNHQVAMIRSPNPMNHPIAMENDVKDSVIQLCVQNRVDVASEVYIKHSGILSPRSKREIWSYVRAWARNDEPVDFLFPSLKI